MPRRSNNRYPTLRRRRRRTLIAAVALLCVCALAYALMGAGSPWTARGGEAPTEDEQSPANGSAANTEEKGVVEATGRDSARYAPTPDRPLPRPEESCDDPRVLVGKENALPPDYQPDDLASLTAYGVPSYSPDGGDLLVRQGSLEPLAELISDANSDGRELLVLSAFRSYAEQQQNFAHFTGIYGEDAEIVSAPPGQSQHQLGTTIDFTNAEVGYDLLPAFKKTSASKWLEENAWRHGFIITYPDGDEQGTGRQHEPWEYRYVGEGLAERIHESDMSLREFLTKEGVRPLC